MYSCHGIHPWLLLYLRIRFCVVKKLKLMRNPTKHPSMLSNACSPIESKMQSARSVRWYDMIISIISYVTHIKQTSTKEIREEKQEKKKKKFLATNFFLTSKFPTQDLCVCLDYLKMHTTETKLSERSKYHISKCTMQSNLYKLKYWVINFYFSHF